MAEDGKDSCETECLVGDNVFSLILRFRFQVFIKVMVKTKAFLDFMQFYASLCVCVLKNWFDHYLQWNQSEHPGVKNLRFTTDQVWTPDILLYNR